MTSHYCSTYYIHTECYVLFYGLDQARATSGPRATYGPPSILMWPMSYILSFINSYIDNVNTLNIKKIFALS